MTWWFGPGYGWGRGWRGGWGRGGWGWRGPWPGRGPFSYLPPWQRPGWLFGKGACWRLLWGPWGYWYWTRGLYPYIIPYPYTIPVYHPYYPYYPWIW